MKNGKKVKKIVIGNWKMNPESSSVAKKLFTDILKQINTIKKTEVVICPPFIYQESLSKISKKILGAQDAFWQENGASTGEISVSMLAGLGIKHVILGHSEKRAGGEDNLTVNKKVKMVLGYGLTPIVCFGEKDRDENHEYLNFIKNQIEEGLNGISKNLISKIIIAYEPVWAIGKNAVREASPEEFREMSVFIRKILSDKFGKNIVDGVRIIYGGSVHPENAIGFLKEGEADGFLVGRDSLNAKKFQAIIKETQNENDENN